MTKAELIEKIAAATGETQASVQAVLDATIDEVNATIANKEAVELGPLGRFVTRDEGPHEGYNFGTGQVEEMPAYTRVLFHPSSELREAIATANAESEAEANED